MGLGELKVYSSLNQPLEAEIELLDVGSVPLSDIKISLASVEEYQNLGLARSYDVDDLAFLVDRNKQGRPLIKIRSTNRISDPFISLVVDLAWVGGQSYRSYTLLLDPPDYQLMMNPHKQVVQTQVITKQSTTHAIPDAPVEEKAEENPPPTTRASTAKTGYWHYESQMPSVPMLRASSTGSHYYIPNIKTFLSAAQDSPAVQATTFPQEAIPEMKAQMELTASAIASVRESNDLLKEQLIELRAQNQKLHERLKQRDEKLNQLQQQLGLLLRRQAIEGQVVQSKEEPHSIPWLWLLLALGLIGGGSVLAWRRWGPPTEWSMDNLFTRLYPNRPQSLEEETPEIGVPPIVVPTKDTSKVTETVEPSVTLTPEPDLPILPVALEMPPQEPNVNKTEPEIEFEPELEFEPEFEFNPETETESFLPELTSLQPESIDPMKEEKTIDEEKLQLLETNASNIPGSNATSKADNHVIEFNLDKDEEDNNAVPPLKPVKSKAAIETLLSLGKTYMDMKDAEAARQTLMEVINDGDADQQAQAQDLLKQLDTP